MNVLIPAVEHHSLHHAPIMTTGVPTPAILLEFGDACEDFFANVKEGIPDEFRIIHILPRFKDPIMQGWISSDCAHLSALEFNIFMKFFWSRFLSKQWEDESLSKIIRDHLHPGQDFLTWVTKLQQQNCILQNTDSQPSFIQLREQILVAVDMELHIAAWEAKVNKVTSLHDFLDIYTLCDERCHAAKNRTHSIIDESYWQNESANKENAFHLYKRDNCPGSASGHPASSSHSHPPKLTLTKIKIIKSCTGCFKCWKIYQSKDHINTESSRKTCKFPSGDNYHPLAWEYANKIKALHNLRKASSLSKVITLTSSAPLSTVPNTSSSIIEVDTLDDANFVASMFGVRLWTISNNCWQSMFKEVSEVENDKNKAVVLSKSWF